MSNDCISGTPAFSIVDSCRVKSARSLCVILRPRENDCFLILLTMTPRRRSDAATTDSPPARISPLTTRPFLSRPSQWKTDSLTSTRGLVFAIAPVAIVVVLLPYVHSLVQPSTSSSDVMPALTFISPDWRRSRTPLAAASRAISGAVALRRIMSCIFSVIGITW